VRRVTKSPNLVGRKHGAEPTRAPETGQAARKSRSGWIVPRPPDKITAMNTVILILLAVTLVAVVAVLLTGVIGMARGGEFNAKYGNKLMRLRVALQGLAIILFILFFVTSGRG